MRVLPGTLITVALLGALGGCGEQSSGTPRRSASSAGDAHRGLSAAAGNAASRSGTAVPAAVRRVPTGPIVTPVTPPTGSWRPVATVDGQVAVWEAQRSRVTLLRFDQRFVALALHAGLDEPSGTWAYGDRIGASEIHRVIAAFNGGFKFETGAVGYMSEGQVAIALQLGRGSIVTYRGGVTQIGAWGSGVPARGRPIASVLQNLQLLVDHGAAASTVETCIESCWGATVGGVTETARSALGIDGNGRLLWAAGEGLSPAAIAGALIGAGVQRAVELDINPDWVAGYLYVHGGSGPKPTPVVPEQLGIAGYFLTPYARDFFTVSAR